MGRLEAELQATRREWADLVEEAGQAAVARELGVSSQAVADRLRRIRANREGRSGGGDRRKGPLAFSGAGCILRSGTGAARAGSATSGQSPLTGIASHRRAAASARNLRAPDGAARHGIAGRKTGRRGQGVCNDGPLRGRPRRTALPSFSTAESKSWAGRRSVVPPGELRDVTRVTYRSLLRTPRIVQRRLSIRPVPLMTSNRVIDSRDSPATGSSRRPPTLQRHRLRTS
jgi:hypothetical protein